MKGTPMWASKKPDLGNKEKGGKWFKDEYKVCLWINERTIKREKQESGEE